MHERDDGECDGAGDEVSGEHVVRRGQAIEEAHDDGRDGGLTDPAERQRRERDAELRAGDVVVETVDRSLGELRAAVARAGERLDARAARADEGELGRDEEAVGGDEQDRNPEAEQDRGQREVRLSRRLRRVGDVLESQQHRVATRLRCRDRLLPGSLI